MVDLKSLNAVYFSFDPCLFQIEIVLQFSGMNLKKCCVFGRE